MPRETPTGYSWRVRGRPVVSAALGPRARMETQMGKRRRNYKLKWRSKKANHGRKPCRGRDRKLA